VPNTHPDVPAARSSFTATSIWIILDEAIVVEAVEEAVRLLQSGLPRRPGAGNERELKTVNAERARLVSPIAAGGQLDGRCRRSRPAKRGGWPWSQSAIVCALSGV
jgi:hypothetical protein